MVLLLTVLLLLTIAAALKFRRDRHACTKALENAHQLYQQSSERLSLALDGADEGLWDWDVLRNRTHYSEHWFRMLGYTADEIADSVEIFQRLVHPEDVAGTLAALDAHINGHSPCYRTEFRMQAKNGEWRWIQARGKVVARTAGGAPSRVVGTHVDITASKRAEEERERIYRELVETQQNLAQLSRLAGMAEVATSVLHNVGNVLNSVNVSATILLEKVRGSRVDRLTALSAMLQQHQHDLASFLHHDPQGSRVIPYLIKFAGHFQDERRTLLSELSQLHDHIDHIKTIVMAQQSHAKVSGLMEPIDLSALIEDACQILQPGLVRHNIAIDREFATVPPIVADKHAVMQILLNLIRNAKDALRETDHAERRIRIRITSSEDSVVAVEITDSGIGIPLENLTRIFSQGFTTKPHGHGFGLHSSALEARKMGGILRAESDGLGHGATFTLEIPLHKSPAMEPDPVTILP